jgi:hypothetical protein
MGAQTEQRGQLLKIGGELFRHGINDWLAISNNLWQGNIDD